MNRLPGYFIALFSVVFLNSCKNDLELNAPYREYPSIYAVMNPQEPMQMIRINKVFLGEGDANVMAKVADSINYKEGELTVSLTRFIGSSQVDASSSPSSKEIVFKDSLITINSGTFSRTQRVYFTYSKLFTNGEYRLRVKNNTTGNVFTASARSLESINPDQGIMPFITQYQYPYPHELPEINYINYSVASATNTIRFIPKGNPGNGYKDGPGAYSLVIRTHFYDDAGVQGKTYDFVDYDLGTRPLSNLVSEFGSSWMKYTFRGSDYFASMGISLSRKKLNQNIIGRKVYMIEYIVYATTQEYMDFLQFSLPSLSISQQKPIYSNFADKTAIGIFTFRSHSAVRKEPSPVFVNEFSRNPNTCGYKFVDFNNVELGCK